MARLIDADEFEVISWRAQGGSGDYKNGFDDGVNYVAQKIDKAQTVDAIPVEWLQRQGHEYMQHNDKLMWDAYAVVLGDWLMKHK